MPVRSSPAADPNVFHNRACSGNLRVWSSPSDLQSHCLGIGLEAGIDADEQKWSGNEGIFILHLLRDRHGLLRMAASSPTSSSAFWPSKHPPH